METEIINKEEKEYLESLEKKAEEKEQQPPIFSQTYIDRLEVQIKLIDKYQDELRKDFGNNFVLIDMDQKARQLFKRTVVRCLKEVDMMEHLARQLVEEARKNKMIKE